MAKQHSKQHSKQDTNQHTNRQRAQESEQSLADTSAATAVKENQVDGVLQNYLDQLLIVATEAPETPDLVDVATEVPVVAPTLENVIEQPQSDNTTVVDGEIQDWEVLDSASPELVAETVVQPTIAEAAEADIQKEVDIAEEALTSSTAKSLEDISDTPVVLAPQLNWDSSQGVDCLIFKVAGLKLAIPLPLLGGVYTVDDKVTPLFGQAKWSLGVWQAEGQKLTVVDSAQLIMPERQVSLQEEGYSYLIQLDRAPWALACQEICDTRDLVSESIKWRGDTSKRPWLAGTVISEMCALIDVPGLLSLLETQR
jgi:purine-binding chemotaxis protein CheW